MDSKAFETQFREVMRNKEVQKVNKQKQVVDGTEFLVLTWEDLRAAVFGKGSLKLKDGRELKMAPGALASVAMLLDCKGE